MLVSTSPTGVHRTPVGGGLLHRFCQRGLCASTMVAALRNITAKWKNVPWEWRPAKWQLAIQLDDRFLLTL